MPTDKQRWINTEGGGAHDVYGVNNDLVWWTVAKNVLGYVFQIRSYTPTTVVLKHIPPLDMPRKKRKELLECEVLNHLVARHLQPLIVEMVQEGVEKIIEDSELRYITGSKDVESISWIRLPHDTPKRDSAELLYKNSWEHKHGAFRTAVVYEGHQYTICAGSGEYPYVDVLREGTFYVQHVPDPAYSLIKRRDALYEKIVELTGQASGIRGYQLEVLRQKGALFAMTEVILTDSFFRLR